MNQTFSPSSIEEAKYLTTSTSSTARNLTIREVSSKKTNSTGGYVDHSYTDYANVSYDDLHRAKGNRSDATDTNTKSIRGRANKTSLCKGRGVHASTLPFPGKLLDVLDQGELTSIIDWMPHGRAFIVKQPKVFTTQVLPRFSRQTKFLSFTRQLNLWGFKRITRGLDEGAYYHELFLPGRLDLSFKMTRQKIKGTGFRPMPNPEKEPNFYGDYPHMKRVQRRSRDTISSSFTQQPAVLGSQSLMTQQAAALGLQSALRGMSTFTNPSLATYNKVHALRAAAAYELRSQRLMEASTHSSNIATTPDSSSSSLNTRGIDLAPNVCLQQAVMRAVVPQSFPHVNDIRGEMTSANRRLLIDRLLDRTADAPPAQEGMLHRSSPESASLHRPSYLDLHEARTMLRRTSMSLSPPTARSESFNVHQSFYQGLHPAALTGAAATPAAPISSLLGSNFPHHRQPNTLSLRNAGSPSGSGQDVNLAAVTNALLEAKHLEDLAKSQRASAWALRGGWHHNGVGEKW